MGDDLKAGAMLPIASDRVATHSSPARRWPRNVMLHCELSVVNLPGRYEQLWTKKVEGGFELLCIPFFAPYALGDTLSIQGTGPAPYTVTGCSNPSSREACRLAVLTEGAEEEFTQAVESLAQAQGLLCEVNVPGYLSVDVGDAAAKGRWFGEGIPSLAQRYALQVEWSGGGHLL